MAVALPENPLLILLILAIPPLLVVLPWRSGWLATFGFLLWADSSMPGAEFPRRIQWRALALGGLFLQGLVRLRGRGHGTPPTLSVAGLVALAAASAVWSETRLPTAANAAALALLVGTCFLFVARYAPSPRTAVDTVHRAIVLLLVLLAVGFVPRLHPEDIWLAGRLRGFFGNPNGLGISCALIAPWVAVLATQREGSKRALAVATLVVLTGLAFLSGSRTGLGGLVVGTATTLFLRHPSRFLLVGIVGGIALSIATVAGGGDIDIEEGAVGTLTRTETVGRLSGRLERWKAGLALFAEAPIVGHGYKWSWGYTAVETREPGEGGDTTTGVSASGMNYHSQHIETLVDHGIVGEALLLLVLLTAWRRARALSARRVDDELAGAGAAFAGTFVAVALDSFFHNWLLTPASPYAFFFWSLFALCLRLHRSAVTVPASPPPISLPTDDARPAMVGLS